MTYMLFNRFPWLFPLTFLKTNFLPGFTRFSRFFGNHAIAKYWWTFPMSLAVAQNSTQLKNKLCNFCLKTAIELYFYLATNNVVHLNLRESTDKGTWVSTVDKKFTKMAHLNTVNTSQYFCIEKNYHQENCLRHAHTIGLQGYWLSWITWWERILTTHASDSKITLPLHFLILLLWIDILKE